MLLFAAPRWVAKVADFGLAKLTDRGEVLGLAPPLRAVAQLQVHSEKLSRSKGHGRTFGPSESEGRPWAVRRVVDYEPAVIDETNVRALSCSFPVAPTEGNVQRRCVAAIGLFQCCAANGQGRHSWAPHSADLMLSPAYWMFSLPCSFESLSAQVNGMTMEFAHLEQHRLFGAVSLFCLSSPPAISLGSLLLAPRPFPAKDRCMAGAGGP